MSDLTLSPQEIRINENKGKIVFLDKNNHERAERIYNGFRNAKSVVDVQRARYFTESFKETEGEALVLRWASNTIKTPIYQH